MNSQHIAAALQRAEAVFERRPQAATSEDSTATSRWEGGLRAVASHANGTEFETDMPGELGGTGQRVTPGWLFRAGVASCAVTSIVLAAATEGVELTALEVQARSRSDVRGLLGMRGEDGRRVYAGPGDFRLEVRISARDASPERLTRLVEDALARSPIPNAVLNATPVALSIDVLAHRSYATA
jgi:uncharacterized OsmC-like protein